ncbi:plant UBX domain-containing protein 8 [Lolium rigidum]|uniref:plant UBX domain-containing protein 8 n=1 Tax=Lolium rigidum TaxID=89674 RepID=UPI001F5D53D6|nr:plant UBX domain-containing protein 8 [Lolium rigidum]
MARPSQEAIDTFISITGADEAAAARKLEEHSGDLNEAVNAYFNDGDRSTTRIIQNPVPDSHDDVMDHMMDLDDPFDPPFSRPMGNPFDILHPGFAERAAAGFFGGRPQVTHPREVRQIPIEVKDTNPETGSSGQGPVIEDVTGRESSYGPEVHGTVVVDEDDDDLPSAYAPTIPRDIPGTYYSAPSAPPLVSDYNNDIEEEMIRAAIEASKRDAEGSTNGLNDVGRENASQVRDNDLAEAVSLSLEAAERERVLRQQGILVDGSSDLSDKEDMEGASETVERQGLIARDVGTSRQLLDEENFQEDIEDVEEEPLVRQRSRRVLSRNAETTEAVQRPDSPPLSPQPHQHNGGFAEWGGISSEEHDEAVMLEAAMFGGIPEHTAYPFPRPSHGISAGYPRVAHPPSPTLTAQRLIREQQDDEYLAALQADREKELKAVEDAELRRVEEAAAREAAIEKQKQENEDKLRKQLEEEELESLLAAKRESLPKEPLPNAEGAVTVVVRMPDGSRQGRRFLRSDQLQVLFDFIDISKTFKPGTYRLVRSYPRRAFTDEECLMSLSDVGLTSKQEALFLEQISG